MEKKKQVPLRLSETLYNDLARWAQDDFRSINGQIEFLLSECVKQRKKSGRYTPEEFNSSVDGDIVCDELLDLVESIRKKSID